MKVRPVLAGGFHRERFPNGEHRETKLKEVCPSARKRFPYYFMLPLDDPIALLKWRRYARNRAIQDKEFRAALWEACRRDVAFFCVTFVWIFEPRPLPRRMPFHPFTSQISLLAWFEEIFGVRDGAVNKTRGIGLTWAVSAFILHKWLFEDSVSIALLTETEDKLDKSEGTNSSFGKLQYIYDNLPEWAKAINPLKRSFGDHSFMNLRGKQLVQGFVATGTKLRQFRFTWLFADEFAFYPKHSQEEWMVSSGGTCGSRLFGCLGADTRIVTDTGIKPIVAVLSTDKLWDGEEWVSHDGLSFQGIQETIRAYGVWLTPTHKVLTKEGWQHAEKNVEKLPVNPPPQRSANAGIHDLGFNDSKVHEPQKYSVLSIRRAGYSSMPTMEILREFPVRHGRTAKGHDIGSHRQQGQLRTPELSLGNPQRTSEQLPQQYTYSDIPRHVDSSRIGGQGGSVSKHYSDSTPPRVCRGSTTATKPKRRTEPVYDLVNAGPRHRFTVVNEAGEYVITANSTWNDFDDMFNHVVYEEESSLLKMSAFWWNDYERWQGAYKMEAGRPVFIDKEFDWTKYPDYQFGEPDLLDEGMIRSPWVDGELSQPGVTDRFRLLRDLYGRAVCERTNRYFTNLAINNVRAAVESLQPSMEGELRIENDKVLVIPTRKSNIRLWRGVPEVDRGPYVCFSDLGGGAGKNYSVTCWIDRAGEQVAEYGINTLGNVEYAAHIAAICRWLGKEGGEGYCLIDFDNIGPLAAPFWKELVRLGYTNIHKTKYIDPKKVRRLQNLGDDGKYYGTTRRDNHTEEFQEFGRAVVEMECLVRSPFILEDMKRVSRDQDKDGVPKLPEGTWGHEDFLVAAAGAWLRAKDTVDQHARDGDDEMESQVQYKVEAEPVRKHLWSAQYDE